MAKELTKDERIIVRGYKEGLKNIRNDINLLYEKYAKDGKLSMADLSKYNRLTNLEKNIADNLKTAYDVQVKTTKKAVKGAFESSFYYSTFELEQEAKIPLMFGLLKKEAVNAVVEGPHRWPQIAKEHTKLTNAKIRDQIMQGVVQGKDVGQVTKAVAKEMNIAASKACRIVRTETHRAQNQGSLDSFMEASKKGVIIQKVWVATLDERTRASHRVMDGQIVEVNEEFIMPGDIKALAPGLSGSASGDINCRCIIRAEVVGYSPQARRSREDGIIPQQTYQQWAKAKGIKFDDRMADEVAKLLKAREAGKVVKPNLIDKPNTKTAEEIEIETQVNDAFNRYKKLARKSLNKNANIKGMEEIEEIVRAQSLELQGLFAKRARKFKGFIDDIDKGEYYQGRKINVNFAETIKDTRGKHSAFFHEYGHFVDDVLTGSRNAFSKKKGFFNLIERDYAEMLESDGRLKRMIKLKLEANDYSSGVQDAISGLSLNKNRIRWGHSTEYWERGETWAEICSETFANMFSALFDDNIAAVFEEYMPMSFAYFKRMLKDKRIK